VLDASDRPIPTPFAQRVDDFKQRRLPLIVWVAAVLTCSFLLLDRAGRFEYLGLARSLDYEVSAATTGQLQSLFVELYDEVEAGDVVVRLDDAEVEARLERSMATIRQLAADLEATRSTILSTNAQDQADWTNNLRRFQTNEEERRLAILELRVAVESGEIEQERLALELRRSAALLDAGLMGQTQYDSSRLRHDEVGRRNEENKVLLTQTEQEYRAAQARRREFERGLPSLPAEEPMLLPLREAITVENRRLEEIRARRESLVLRSPVAGQVSQVLCRRGQTVLAGEPILTIVEHGVQEIVTFIAESDNRIVQRQSTVRVSSIARPERIAESYVVRTGPGIEQLPERLWQSPAIPAYGRAIVIAATPSLSLTPGELLHVRFIER